MDYTKDELKDETPIAYKPTKKRLSSQSLPLD